jgi:signal transduction histidine kinase
MNTDVLHIILVEDDPVDIEMEMDLLEQEGLHCEIRTVQTREQYLSAIEEGSPDLIIADYKLPAFDGFTALALAHARIPEVPFIFVTGSLGEEVVIQALKNGATDYILKDRLRRLPIAVRRALQERKEHLEHRQLQSQLLQSQKLEAIGTLAGGIAHDFNNILGGILGYTEAALYELPEDSEARGHLKNALALVGRATSLVRQILAFSRKDVAERKPVASHALVKEALKLLRASIPSTIEIRAEISPEAGMIMADPTQIHQVLLNLCTNAVHAMEGGMGVLSIRLSPEVLDAAAARAAGDLPPGRYVKLTVADTGSGIDPAILDRIFEPFFSTKEKQKGTGLGLWVVHGIIKSHGGSISVTSTPGTGSSFSVRLPRLAEESEGQPVGDQGPLPVGSERILFVDDEEQLVEVGRTTLQSLGYFVIATTSSKRALEIFREAPQAFDLVITDQTMPALTGSELTRELRKIKPGLPVILCTGYDDAVPEETARQVGVEVMLRKPIFRRQLAEAVRAALRKGCPGR